MFKRLVTAAVMACGLMLTTAGPAAAFTTPPSETMIIINYYDGSGKLVGQEWRCSYGGGSWGITTNDSSVTFGIC